MNQEQEDRWLKVLAGRAKAQDHETRQAESLREFFKLQEQNTPALDTAAQRRIMNMLEAKGAFRQAAPAPAKKAGWAAPVLAWLFPDGHANTGRFAAVAVAVFAVALLPALLQGPADQDNPHTMKGLPPGLGQPTAVIASANPAQSAAQLLALLSRHGVMATVRPDGADRWVQAQVPPDKLDAVQADLMAIGVAAGPGGAIAVQFRRLP